MGVGKRLLASPGRVFKMNNIEKEFDRWNEIKKSIHEKPDNFGVHEREIWWLSLGINIGVEIDGKNKDFERPVLILRKFNRQMVWVFPITSRAKNLKFYEKFTFGDREYFIAITQIRTVSTKRFLRKIGMMNNDDFIRIKQKLVLFINENPQSGFSRRPKP